jgi:predicted nucleic acid-binding protein
MIVVSDTSPLNYLALTGDLPLLPNLFGEVVIPPAVARELAHARAPAPTRAFIATPPQWLKIVEPVGATLAAMMATPPKLGRGELEAICIAKDMKAALLLTDERRATREARERYHLRVTGLLGVIELAAIRGLVDLPQFIKRLKQTSFRMPKATVARLLQEHTARQARTTSKPAEPST